MVPYCTQHVHIGDAQDTSYNDGERIVHHVGVHTMQRTLDWIFKQFPNPTHGRSDFMFLKGSRGPRAVYLTPVLEF
eukprot:scaffold2457_cov110-Alexandrium_tamarense.AAC.1